MSRDRSVRNVTRGTVLASRVARAADPWTRFLGLLPRGAVAPDEGLWIDGCAAVHTLGMRATIDLYFLDRERRVVRVVENVPPGRLSEAARGANTVVELGSGAIPPRHVVIGDVLVLE